MAGFVPDEGEVMSGALVYKNTSADRGTSLELGLFTNVAPGETITEATITEPTGGSYARISLADASWAGTNPVTFAQQQFSPSGGDYTGSVQGYFIASTGTTARIIAIEVDSAGPYTLTDGDTYDIDLSNAFA